MAITAHQAGTVNTATSGSSVNATALASAPPAGDLLTLAVAFYNRTVSSVTATSTFTKALAEQDGSNSDAEIWYAANCTGGGSGAGSDKEPTVNASGTLTDGVAVWYNDWAGAATSSALDGTGTFASGATSPGTYTPSQNGDLLISVCSSSDNSITSPGSPWTDLGAENLSFLKSDAIYLIQTAATPENPTFGGSVLYSATILIGFKTGIISATGSLSASFLASGNTLTSASLTGSFLASATGAITEAATGSAVGSFLASNPTTPGVGFFGSGSVIASFLASGSPQITDYPKAALVANFLAAGNTLVTGSLMASFLASGSGVVEGHGTGSLVASFLASGSASVHLLLFSTGLYAVTTGNIYTAMMSFLTSATPRNCAVQLAWYESDGATLISDAQGSTVVDATTEWTKSTVTAAQAPSNAAYAKVQGLVENASSSEVHYATRAALFNTAPFVPNTGWAPGQRGLVPTRRLRHISTWDSVAYPIFDMFIDSFTPRYGQSRSTLEIQATDGMKLLGTGYWTASLYDSGLYIAEVLTLSAKGAWRLGDAVGASSAADSSGNGHTGTVIGAVAFGQDGPLWTDPATAADFSATSTWNAISLPSGAAITANLWTVEAWFKLSSAPSTLEPAVIFTQTNGSTPAGPMLAIGSSGPASDLSSAQANVTSAQAAYTAAAAQLSTDQGTYNTDWNLAKSAAAQAYSDAADIYAYANTPLGGDITNLWTAAGDVAGSNGGAASTGNAALEDGADGCQWGVAAMYELITTLQSELNSAYSTAGSFASQSTPTALVAAINNYLGILSSAVGNSSTLQSYASTVGNAYATFQGFVDNYASYLPAGSPLPAAVAQTITNAQTVASDIQSLVTGISNAQQSAQAALSAAQTALSDAGAVSQDTTSANAADATLVSAQAQVTFDENAPAGGVLVGYVMNNSGTAISKAIFTEGSNAQSQVCDGNWHQAVLVNNGSHLYLYLDGVASSVVPTVASNSISAGASFIGAPASTVQTNYAPFPGQLGDVNTYPSALSATNVALLYKLGVLGLDAPVLSGARVTDILTLAGFNPSDEHVATGQVYVQAPDFSTLASSYHLTYIQLVESTEAGYFFFDANGEPTFWDRTYITTNASSLTPQAVLANDTNPAHYPFEHKQLALSDDDLDIWNDFPVQAVNGLTQRAQDKTSQQRYGVRTNANFTNMQFEYDSDSAVLANYLVSKFATPILRPRSIMLVNTTRGGAGFPVMLGLKIMDMVEILWTPPGATSALDQNVWIESIQHEVTKTTWKTVFALSATDGVGSW